jgi:hypothetical protein
MVLVSLNPFLDFPSNGSVYVVTVFPSFSVSGASMSKMEVVLLSSRPCQFLDIGWYRFLFLGGGGGSLCGECCCS